MANNPLDPHMLYNAMRAAAEAYSVAVDEDTAFAASMCTSPSTSLATYNAWLADIAATLAWLELPWHERACVEWEMQEKREAA